jgi:hypothetical protein
MSAVIEKVRQKDKTRQTGVSSRAAKTRWYGAKLHCWRQRLWKEEEKETRGGKKRGDE